MDNVQRRRLPHVINVPLVGNTEDVYAGTAQRFGHVVQRVLDFVDNEMRHLAVDVAGEFNKTCLDAGLF
jgi:hypothetical protein